MNSKINLLCIAPHFKSGGSERVMLNIVNNLNKDKFNISLLIINNEGTLLKDLKDDITLFSTRHKKVSRSVFSIKKIIEENNFDIIFTMKGYITLFILIAKFISRKKTPVVYREVTHVSTDIFNNPGKINLFLKHILKYVYGGTKRIIAPSKSIADDLIKNFSVSSEKIETIHNPLDTILLKEKLTEETDEKWFSENIPVIISTGRMTKVKDFKTLIKSTSIVNKSLEARLILVGEGEELDYLKNYSANLNIDKNIKFLGNKSNPFKYMYKSDIYVMSSLFEGFPNALAEGMFCGVACIATNCISGVSDLIDNNINGIIVPIGDAEQMASKIIYLLKNKPIREQFGARAKDKVENMLNIEKIISNYEKVFIDVAKRFGD